MKITNVSIRYALAIGGAREHIKQIAEGLVQHAHSIWVYTSDFKEHLQLKKMKAYGQKTINVVQINRLCSITLGSC